VKIVDRHFDFDKVYYLGGPVTGYPDFNRAAFGEAQAELEAAGVKVKSPHTVIEGPLDDDDAWRQMMRRAIRMLLECDGAILMRGFINSRGSLIEHSISLALGMPVYFLDGKYLIPMHDPARKIR